MSAAHYAAGVLLCFPAWFILAAIFNHSNGNRPEDYGAVNGMALACVVPLYAAYVLLCAFK